MNVFILSLLMTIPDPIASSVDSLARLHQEEVQAWHERRVRNLMREYGWLTLVGLDWLEEGANAIHGVGRLMLDKGTVSLQLQPGVKALLNDAQFSGGSIRVESEGVAPDTIRVATRAFIVMKRGNRYAVRTWDTEAKNRKEFMGIERYPVRGAWRIEARWHPYHPPKVVHVPTVIPGYEQEYPVPGVAVFTIGGNEYRLEPVLEAPDAEYFFIFGDLTNRRETYGAGRFLYAKREQDGKVILDFNKSYNPPCAFTEYATCPLPPPQNKLPIRVEAGEKRYGVH